MEYIGVDVSKASLEVSNALGTRRKKFDNTASGIRRLSDWLKLGSEEEGVHLVIEPTSSYHLPLLQALASGGTACSTINPARSAAFARAKGLRAKTDPVDARMLASLGETQQPQPDMPPDEGREEAKATRRHLEWLEQEVRRVRNRREAAQFSPWTPDAVLDSLERTIDQLEEEIAKLRKSLDQQLESHPKLAAQLQLLLSIPGVGKKTAQLLLSEMPAVSNFTDGGQWAAFCGLTPEPRQSGKGNYSRLCRAGTARVRAGLYLPAVCALRHNPLVMELGERLLARGKSSRVRIVAAMHKLMRLCYGVLKSGRPFDPNHNKPIPDLAI